MWLVSGLNMQRWKNWAIGVAVVIVAHAAIFGMMQVIKSAGDEHEREAAEAAAAEKAAKVPEPIPVFIIPPPAPPSR